MADKIECLTSALCSRSRLLASIEAFIPSEAGKRMTYDQVKSNVTEIWEVSQYSIPKRKVWSRDSATFRSFCKCSQRTTLVHLLWQISAGIHPALTRLQQNKTHEKRRGQNPGLTVAWLHGEPKNRIQYNILFCSQQLERYCLPGPVLSLKLCDNFSKIEPDLKQSPLVGSAQ